MLDKKINKDDPVVLHKISLSINGRATDFVCLDYKDIEKYKNIQQTNQNLISVLDSIDALIYAADLNSYEVVYINNYGKKIWGNVVGEKCWQVLQDNQTGPCEFCNNEELVAESRNLDGNMKREFRNSKNGKWYECRDTIIRWADGRLVRLEIAADITERKEVEEKKNYYSIHDRLTGLYNRYYFEEELKRLDTERQLPLGIIFADINNLKLINDIHGYNNGDKVIKGAAVGIKQCCRTEDIVTRWGGDEFIILLPRAKPEELQAITSRLYNSFSKKQIDKLPLSMAFGSALKTSPDQSMYDVLRVAEMQMRSNKNSGSREASAKLLKFLFIQIEQKSYESFEHIKRLRNLSLSIGKKLNLPQTELSKLAKLSVLHDIGLVRIVEEELMKTEKLAEQQWEMLKLHPREGWRIARATRDFAHIAEDILCHHEWWDGSGYPLGLKGREIPPLARIFAIADAYEVMTSGRPYKKALTRREAIEELIKGAGTQFDPNLIRLIINN